VIPVINKIDLPGASIDLTARYMETKGLILLVEVLDGSLKFVYHYIEKVIQ